MWTGVGASNRLAGGICDTAVVCRWRISQEVDTADLLQEHGEKIKGDVRKEKRNVM